MPGGRGGQRATSAQGFERGGRCQLDESTINAQARQWSSTEPATSARYALLLHGRIGTLRAPPSISLVQKNLQLRDYAKAMATTAASHIEHVVRANAGGHHADGGGGVDVFAHSWNPFLGELFDRTYAPHLRASWHQPIEYCDKEKPRSQALSIGRAAQLMAAHEAARKQPYTFCLVLRSDLFVGAPIDLRGFDARKIWFAEHCCLNDAVDVPTQALVRARCPHSPTATPRSLYSKRVLGPCRVSQYGGARAHPRPSLHSYCCCTCTHTRAHTRTSCPRPTTLQSA